MFCKGTLGTYVTYVSPHPPRQRVQPTRTDRPHRVAIRALNRGKLPCAQMTDDGPIADRDTEQSIKEVGQVCLLRKETPNRSRNRGRNESEIVQLASQLENRCFSATREGSHRNNSVAGYKRLMRRRHGRVTADLGLAGNAPVF